MFIKQPTVLTSLISVVFLIIVFQDHQTRVYFLKRVSFMHEEISNASACRRDGFMITCAFTSCHFLELLMEVNEVLSQVENNAMVHHG